MGAPSIALAIDAEENATPEFTLEPGESATFGLRFPADAKVSSESTLATIELKDDLGKWHEMPNMRIRYGNRLFTVDKPGTWRIARPEELKAVVAIFKTH